MLSACLTSFLIVGLFFTAITESAAQWKQQGCFQHMELFKNVLNAGIFKDLNCVNRIVRNQECRKKLFRQMNLFSRGKLKSDMLDSESEQIFQP